MCLGKIHDILFLYKGVNDMEKVFQVEGMMCGGCEKRVNTALSAVEGVSECKADASTNTVRTVERCVVNETTLASTIEDTGYDVIG